MAAEQTSKSSKVSKQEYDVISNRLSLAIAKRESLIKSWTASSSRPRETTKSQAELDAEDAALFRSQPTYLGVGAPIPSNFLVGEAERNTKSLRAKLFPAKELKASKARNAEEKASSAKRGLNIESSDEEEGRSGLGRAKKLRAKSRTESAHHTKPQKEPRPRVEEETDHMPMDIDENELLPGINILRPPRPISSTAEVAQKRAENLAAQPKPLNLTEPEPAVTNHQAGASNLEGVKQIQPASLDAKERKKLKKREQKLRKRARQRAAALAAQEN